MKKFKLVYVVLKWKPKTSMQIIEVAYNEFVSKEAAMGYAHNTYDLSYMDNQKKENRAIIWNGEPHHSNNLYKIGFVLPIKDNSDIGFNISRGNMNLKRTLENMYNDWYKFDKTVYTDQSLLLSDLAKKTTIPKGWKPVRPGTIIRKTDMEWHDYSRSGGHWFEPSWYNIGKKVKAGYYYSITTLKEGKSTTKRRRTENDPLIIRKINK